MCQFHVIGDVGVMYVIAYSSLELIYACVHMHTHTHTHTRTHTHTHTHTSCWSPPSHIHQLLVSHSPLNTLTSCGLLLLLLLPLLQAAEALKKLTSNNEEDYGLSYADELMLEIDFETVIDDEDSGVDEYVMFKDSLQGVWVVLCLQYYSHSLDVTS